MADLLFTVWRGAGNDQSLWWTNGDWTPPNPSLSCAQYHVGNEGSSNSPALAAYQDRLFAGWKGAGDHKYIYWTPFEGTNWARPPVRPSDPGTSNGPAIASDSALPEPDHGKIPGPSRSSRPIPPISPRNNGGPPSSFTARSAPANPPDDVAHVVDGCASAVLWFVVVGVVGALLVPFLTSWLGLAQTGERAILSLAVLILWFGGTAAVFIYKVMKRTHAARS
jgi:hypothetical protein